MSDHRIDWTGGAAAMSGLGLAWIALGVGVTYLIGRPLGRHSTE